VANPPSKLPLITLLKQARAFGLGVVLATQNPIDLDYKALSNAGTWFIGRLQTERDKERVLDGLEGAAVTGQKQFSRQNFDKIMSGLGNRIFLMNDVHEDTPAIFETRWAMSYLRGPLTREQIKMLVEPLKKQKTIITPQTPSSPSPIITSADNITLLKTNNPPIIPPDIRVYYMPFEKNTQAQMDLTYQPMIIGAAQIQYSELKETIGTLVEKVFITPISDNPLPVNWDESNEVNINISQLRNTQQENLPYTELPSAATKAKNYASWEKDFKNWIFKTQKIQLFRSPILNEISKSGETETDFRIRLQQMAREKRDQQVEKLRKKYTSDFNRLDERIRRARMVQEEQQAQAKSQKYQIAVSLGETLLGSFLGRKSSTRVTRATKEITRSMKEERDKENAEANLIALQQERAKLEAQFQLEINQLETKIDPLNEALENIYYTPSRTGVQVQLVALLWTTG